jgi:hypothetical protein
LIDTSEGFDDTRHQTAEVYRKLREIVSFDEKEVVR